jgi:replicative DNA helicase
MEYYCEISGESVFMTDLNYSHLLEQRVLENLMHFGTHTAHRAQKAMLELSGECFYNPDHQEIFGIIWKSFYDSEGFNFYDILMKMRRNCPSEATLNWITDNHRQLWVNADSFESDVAKLIITAQLRKQIAIAKDMIVQVENAISPNDARDILNRHISEISSLNFTKSKDGISEIDLADEYLEGNLPPDMRISTTSKQLNLALGGGVVPKSLITIAAAAGVGKTGFAIFLLDSIARAEPGKHSLFFSLEMEAKHIWMRHVGIKAGRLFDTIPSDKMMDYIASCLEIPLTIYDTSMSRSTDDIDYILTMSRLKSAEKPLSVIVVDYLGLVKNKGNFERNDLRQADITSKLAKLALELNCIVIALSQVNRNSSGREDKCPRPEDAADSSGSHRSSALWLGLDRPGEYRDEPDFKNQFIVKCRKNRFGNSFELIYAFNDGTFGEVKEGYFKKPFARVKSFEETLLSKD